MQTVPWSWYHCFWKGSTLLQWLQHAVLCFGTRPPNPRPTSRRWSTRLMLTVTWWIAKRKTLISFWMHALLIKNLCHHTCLNIRVDHFVKLPTSWFTHQLWAHALREHTINSTVAHDISWFLVHRPCLASRLHGWDFRMAHSPRHFVFEATSPKEDAIASGFIPMMHCGWLLSRRSDKQGAKTQAFFQVWHSAQTLFCRT